MMKTIESIISFFFPKLCIICESRLQGGEQHICIDCMESLPRTSYHKQDENRLEHYLAGKFQFEKAAAFCYYYKEGGLQKVIRELKYNNNPQLAVYMGKLYGSELKGSTFIQEIDYLVPIPLHPKKQKQRGYNQAEEICKGMSEVTGIPICARAVMRAINNPSQTKHSKTERWENVKGIFTNADVNLLKGKNILIVDDVITTGSTIEAIVKSFSENDCPKISIAAIGIAM